MPKLSVYNGKIWIEISQSGADGSPDLAETIVAKLESLEDDERLDVKAIKGIEELVKRLEKKIDGKVFYGGGSGGKGRIKSYNLQPFLNGITKTFNLPAFWTIVAVHSQGSSPTTFLPLTDYTFDSSSITFTSQVNASTTLSGNEAIIVIYEEA